MSREQPSAAVEAPYAWALEQMRVPQAHAIGRGDPSVIVAVLDLGYRPHPDHAGHLWVNPAPTRGDVHGWDFADGDASLEYSGPGEETSEYLRGHHSFVVGEVAAVAPGCRTMVCRVGYGAGQADSWWQAIDYAVDHGARVLVEPHGYIHGQAETGVPWFYQGTDFAYPHDLARLRLAYERAYRAGCLTIKGVCDNRGRRVAAAIAALDAVLAVGSSNHRGTAADIAADADYAEVAAPSGSRTEGDAAQVLGTGGDGNYIRMNGGCMSSGFAGGVAALVFSRYPQLSNEQVRQVLRNTAAGRGWDTRLGHGVLDAEAALSLAPWQLAQRLEVRPGATIERQGDGWRARLTLANAGAYDVQRALVVVYNGDPMRPAHPAATREQANILLVRQLGHAIVPVMGLEETAVEVSLSGWDGATSLYCQACSLDLGGANEAVTARL